MQRALSAERQISCFQKHRFALLPFIICLYQTKLARTGRSGNGSLGFRLVYRHMDSVFTSLCTCSLPSKSLHLSGLSLFLCFVLKQPVSFTQTPAQSTHSSQHSSASLLYLCAESPSQSRGLDMKLFFFAWEYFPLPFASRQKGFFLLTITLHLHWVCLLRAPQSPLHTLCRNQWRVNALGLSYYFCVLSYSTLCHRNWLGDWQG